MLGDNGFGNPFKLRGSTRELVVDNYRREINFTAEQLSVLCGAVVLGCWCDPEQSCHADILLKC